jgi:hypothetical protein
MLKGELRREKRLLSRTKECVDRVGAYNEVSEGVFRVPFPPRSGTTGVAHEPRPGKHGSTTTC